MADPIVYVDTSRIREGKLDELKVATKRLVAFIEANNPHVISYGIFLDEDAMSMSVVAVHRDSAALDFHMNVGDAEFRKFAGLIDLRSIAVYGEVSEAVVERLNGKAQKLGTGAVAVHRAHAGFSR